MLTSSKQDKKKEVLRPLLSFVCCFFYKILSKSSEAPIPRNIQMSAMPRTSAIAKNTCVEVPKNKIPTNTAIKSKTTVNTINSVITVTVLS